LAGAHLEQDEVSERLCTACEKLLRRKQTDEELANLALAPILHGKVAPEGVAGDLQIWDAYEQPGEPVIVMWVNGMVVQRKKLSMQVKSVQRVRTLARW
jgi:hypothetical protein